MASETITPNVGLQVPAFGQANWQVPNNYNWNLIDLIFGGSQQIPALNVVNLTIGNFAPVMAATFVAEAPSGSTPSTVYTLTYNPGLLIALFVNGIFQRPILDYTVSGKIVTLSKTTQSGDYVYAVYLN